MMPLTASRKSIRGRPPRSSWGRRGVLQEDRLDPSPEVVIDLPDGFQRLDCTLRPSRGVASRGWSPYLKIRIPMS